MTTSRRALLRMLVGGDATTRDTLVVVFLRGAADALSMVAPWHERAYYDARPNLSIARPDDAGTDAAARLRDLDGRFGFHPAMDPLLPFWKDGLLGVVHAAGSDDSTRSHFEAQDLMEHGRSEAGGGAGVGGGWLGRHLRLRPGPQPTALSAIALGAAMPESLRGAPAAAAVTSISEFRLGSGPTTDDASPPPGLEPRDPAAARRDAPMGTRLAPALARLYAGDSPLARAGRDTLAVLAAVERLRAEAYEPRHGASYPGTGFGRALQEVARLARADIGLEVACLDVDGWDTHFVQGTTGGLVAGRIGELAGGVAAFLTDLKDRMDRTTVVVMSEFGRRLAENSSFGTDHGRGGVMLLAGGAIAGGTVHGEWPGLAPDELEDGLDLRVTTDYRTVLGEVLARRCGQARHAGVFPGHTLAPLGVCRA